MLALIASLAVEGEAEKAATNPVIPDAAELFWAAVLFILLWALMRYVLLPPLTKIMRARDSPHWGRRSSWSAPSPRPRRFVATTTRRSTTLAPKLHG